MLELTDRLAADRIWRLKEISSVLKLARSPGLGPVEREFYHRAGAALFYAHWEGFIKRSATCYLQYVANQRPRVDEMADFLLCTFLQTRIADLSDRKRLLEIGDMLLRAPQTQPKINYKDAVSTEANLSSTVFKRILDQLGLPMRPFETKLQAIDSKILKNRHPIAHGAKGEIDSEMLEEIGTLVIELCASFRDELENAAATRSYLRV